MASLIVLLGLFPKTAEIEAKRAALEKEFANLQEFLKSPELLEYNELDKTVNSSEFAQRKKEIQAQKYSDTEEYRKEQQLLKGSKDPEIKNYYKILASSELKNLKEFEISEELKKYLKLEKFMDSEEYKSVKKYMALSPAKKFEQTELYKNLQQYQQQKNSQEIKNYYKVIKNAAYPDFKKLLDSDRLKSFTKLETYIKSGEVEQAKRNLNKKEFRQSEENKKLTEYNYLRKSKEFKNYLKITGLPYFNDYVRLQDSSEIEAFEELQKHILSEEFKQERKKIETAKFKDSQEYRKEQEFLTLKNSKTFKDNFKFKASGNYNNYLKLEGSEKISEYEDLKTFIASDKFKTVKDYMLLPGKKKYLQSEEHKQELRYQELFASEKIKWYLDVKDSSKFDELKNWKLTFSDEFEAAKLDRKKWITKYFWGETILHDSYSLADEKQFYSDGKNVEISDSVLKIITRKEKAEGKAWNPKIGFFPKEFDYTSGLISTGGSFRQQYGIFEAKIKFNKNYPVTQTFWMLADQILPHIDVAKAQKKLSISNIWGNITASDGVKKLTSKIGLSKLTSDFFIYRLEWHADKLIWKINGLSIATATEGIPKTPMYLVLSSSLYKDVNGTVLPAAMEIDWVRCYQAAE